MADEIIKKTNKSDEIKQLENKSVYKSQENVVKDLKNYDGYVLGIDFGTSNSVVSIINGRKEEEVIPTGMLGNVVPSIVFYESLSKVVVGEEAKAYLGLYPDRTIRSIKRILGKTIDDKDVKEYIEQYNVTFNDEERRFYFNILGRQISAEEVAGEIFKKIKQIAEQYLGRECKYAVVTVPANYTKFQREAIKDSAEIAGLEVVRMINEPTAAALAYGIKGDKDGKFYGVYDLGGGTYDITIIKLLENEIKVLATDGDINLGGNDFDNAIAQHFIFEVIEQKIPNFKISENAGLWQDLVEQSEIIKKDLSNKPKSYGNIIYNGEQFELELDRKKAERIVSDLIEKTITVTKRAIYQAGISKDKISKIILVGGMTNMTAIRDALKKEFGEDKIDFGMDAFKTVSIGAAYQGAMLQGRIKESTLGDVVPIPLGIETRDGGFEIILDKNTPIDTVKSKTFTTSIDGQDKLIIEVFQGVRPIAKLNQSLGYFEFIIPPRPRGGIQVEVMFKLNSNGILEVNARNKEDMRTENIIVNTFSSFSRVDIKRIREDSDRQQKLYASQDLKYSLFLDELNIGYNILNKAKSTTIEIAGRLVEYSKKIFVTAYPTWVTDMKKLVSDISAEIDGLQKDLEEGTLLIQEINTENEDTILKIADEKANIIRRRVTLLNGYIAEKLKIEKDIIKNQVAKGDKKITYQKDYTQEYQDAKKKLETTVVNEPDMLKNEKSNELISQLGNVLGGSKNNKINKNMFKDKLDLNKSSNLTFKKQEKQVLEDDFQKSKNDLENLKNQSNKNIENAKELKKVDLTSVFPIQKGDVTNTTTSDSEKTKEGFFDKAFGFLKKNKGTNNVTKLEIKEITPSLSLKQNTKDIFSKEQKTDLKGIDLLPNETDNKSVSDDFATDNKLNTAIVKNKFLIIKIGSSKLRVKLPSNAKSAFFLKKENEIIVVDFDNKKLKLSEGKTLALLYLGGTLPYNIVKKYRQEIVKNLNLRQLNRIKSVKVKSGDKFIDLKYKVKDFIFNDGGLKSMDITNGKITNINL